MGYIGSQPATNFETVRKQVSTTNSGTTITLDYSVSSVQDILVTVNAVVQSYDNYSVSGTTLTLGGTLNNDRVEILYVGRTFQTVNPPNGSVGLSQLSATGTKDATTFLRGDNTFAAAGGAQYTSRQVFTSSGTWTKPTDITKIKVIVQASGGGGGSQGTGGGAGGTSIKWIDVSSISSETVTVGVAGTGSGGTGNGGNGNTSSFGSHCSATGGQGGQGGTATDESPATGGDGVSGDINFKGAAGGVYRGSFGGTSYFGGHTLATQPAYGAGGKGGQSGIASNAGGEGIVYVEEYK